ncbi:MULTISPECIES: hypothetical protein [Haloarcula]|uniref:Uncharacterized protein n=1 Tax=Haloarcula pellucida TaxID=1427151 RepID=A0A830GJ08_9EURY|nr:MULTISPECIES: hypothetical protein [Halomicroarcula]MBX0347602.1 hypothetical protein [Halomicroarcula pellucida]MDS0276477.1 hypothetical protein [Halomicroarcula sp. S1AR25-4]GGN89494.1 hypothetical protein GCM10009030_10300 [Halomicroarcula pellucida]
MNADILRVVRLTVLFLVAGTLLGAGIWTYWRLGLVVGLASVLASVLLVSYAGYDTYRFATA